MSSQKEAPYEKGSFADLANRAITKIQRYAESDDVRENLVALNAIFFIIIGGFILASLFSQSNTIFSVTFLVILVVSIVFSAILSHGYIRLMEPIIKFESGAQNGLRLGIILQFIALTAALAGLLFSQQILIKAALGLLCLQIIAPIVGVLLPTVGPEMNEQTKGVGLGTALGRTAAIITISTFIFDAILFAIRYAG